MKLIYVSDIEIEGIKREKKGKGFRYIYKGEKIVDKIILDRINKLVIPPAWSKVWICPEENGHLQVTGFDTMNRKQYIYHHLWVIQRDKKKYHRMIQFAHALPSIRLQVEKHLVLKGLPREKVLALIIKLMEHTNIRVGNNSYEKRYGSFGLTTLKDKHIEITGGNIKFSFKGKKGIYHNISLQNTRLARIVQRCKEIPGKELFQYYDYEGNRQSIDSGMVNDYIKEISGDDFTSKDFRTWAGTVNTFLAFKELGKGETETEKKKIISEAIDNVAKQLGNTRAVCKKYYVHPEIIVSFENDTLFEYFKQLDNIVENDNPMDLSREEKMVLSILEKKK